MYVIIMYVSVCLSLKLTNRDESGAWLAIVTRIFFSFFLFYYYFPPFAIWESERRLLRTHFLSIRLSFYPFEGHTQRVLFCFFFFHFLCDWDMILTWLLSLFGKTGDPGKREKKTKQKKTKKRVQMMMTQKTVIYRFTTSAIRSSCNSNSSSSFGFSDYLSPDFFLCCCYSSIVGLHFALFVWQLIWRVAMKKDKWQCPERVSKSSANRIERLVSVCTGVDYKVKVERCCWSIRVVSVKKMETQTHWKREKERQRDRDRV